MGERNRPVARLALGLVLLHRHSHFDRLQHQAWDLLTDIYLGYLAELATRAMAHAEHAQHTRPCMADLRHLFTRAEIEDMSDYVRLWRGLDSNTKEVVGLLRRADHEHPSLSAIALPFPFQPLDDTSTATSTPSTASQVGFFLPWLPPLPLDDEDQHLLSTPPSLQAPQQQPTHTQASLASERQQLTQWPSRRRRQRNPFLVMDGDPDLLAVAAPSTDIALPDWTTTPRRRLSDDQTSGQATPPMILEQPKEQSIVYTLKHFFDTSSTHGTTTTQPTLLPTPYLTHNLTDQRLFLPTLQDASLFGPSVHSTKNASILDVIKEPELSKRRLDIEQPKSQSASQDNVQEWIPVVEVEQKSQVDDEGAVVSTKHDDSAGANQNTETDLDHHGQKENPLADRMDVVEEQEKSSRHDHHIHSISVSSTAGFSKINPEKPTPPSTQQSTLPLTRVELLHSKEPDTAPRTTSSQLNGNAPPVTDLSSAPETAQAMTTTQEQQQQKTSEPPKVKIRLGLLSSKPK